VAQLPLRRADRTVQQTRVSWSAATAPGGTIAKPENDSSTLVEEAASLDGQHATVGVPARAHSPACPRVIGSAWRTTGYAIPSTALTGASFPPSMDDPPGRTPPRGRAHAWVVSAGRVSSPGSPGGRAPGRASYGRLNGRPRESTAHSGPHPDDQAPAPRHRHRQPPRPPFCCPRCRSMPVPRTRCRSAGPDPADNSRTNDQEA
jgi:hypothetical protein